MKESKDFYGWVVTTGIFIGIVSAYFSVPYFATELIMMSSSALGCYVMWYSEQKFENKGGNNGRGQ